MIRMTGASSVTALRNDHPLEACLLLRSLTIVVLKTRVVSSALIAKFGTHPHPPLHASSIVTPLSFTNRLEKSPLSVMSGTGEALTHTFLCGVSVSVACKFIHLY